jgi:AcrR family transcriptional regulator
MFICVRIGEAITMTPRSEKELERIRAARRDTILDAALAQFAGHGFHAASIDRIARAAGVSKGLVYNYFDGKEHLLAAVFLRFIEELEHELSEFWERADSPDAIDEFIEGSFAVALRNKERWRLYMSLFMQPTIPESIRHTMTGYMRRALGGMERYLLKAGIKNAEAEAWLLSATLDGIFLYYLIDEQHCPLEKISSILIERYRAALDAQRP